MENNQEGFFTTPSNPPRNTKKTIFYPENSFATTYPLILSPIEKPTFYYVNNPEDMQKFSKLLGIDCRPNTTTYEILNYPKNSGSIVNNNNGTFTFDPGNDFKNLARGKTRQVSFNFKITNANGVENTEVATITVTGTQGKPKAQVANLTRQEKTNGAITASFSSTKLEEGESEDFYITEVAALKYHPEQKKRCYGIFTDKNKTTSKIKAQQKYLGTYLGIRETISSEKEYVYGFDVSSKGKNQIINAENLCNYLAFANHSFDSNCAAYLRKEIDLENEVDFYLKDSINSHEQLLATYQGYFSAANVKMVFLDKTDDWRVPDNRILDQRHLYADSELILKNDIAVKLGIKHSTAFVATKLFVAVANQDYTEVEKLLKTDNPEQPTYALERDPNNSQQFIVSPLYKQQNITPLMLACVLGSKELVKLLLKRRGNVNRCGLHSGNSLLLLTFDGLADTATQLEIAKEIVAYKPFLQTVNGNNESIIHYAIKNQRLDILKFVIQALQKDTKTQDNLLDLIFLHTEGDLLFKCLTDPRYIEYFNLLKQLVPKNWHNNFCIFPDILNKIISETKIDRLEKVLDNFNTNFDIYKDKQLMKIVKERLTARSELEPQNTQLSALTTKITQMKPTKNSSSNKAPASTKMTANKRKTSEETENTHQSNNNDEPSPTTSKKKKQALNTATSSKKTNNNQESTPTKALNKKRKIFNETENFEDPTDQTSIQFKTPLNKRRKAIQARTFSDEELETQIIKNLPNILELKKQIKRQDKFFHYNTKEDGNRYLSLVYQISPPDNCIFSEDKEAFWKAILKYLKNTYDLDTYENDITKYSHHVLCIDNSGLWQKQYLFTFSAAGNNKIHFIHPEQATPGSVFLKFGLAEKLTKALLSKTEKESEKTATKSQNPPLISKKDASEIDLNAHIKKGYSEFVALREKHHKPTDKKLPYYVKRKKQYLSYVYVIPPIDHESNEQRDLFSQMIFRHLSSHTGKVFPEDILRIDSAGKWEEANPFKSKSTAGTLHFIEKTDAEIGSVIVKGRSANYLYNQFKNTLKNANTGNKNIQQSSNKNTSDQEIDTVTDTVDKTTSAKKPTNNISVPELVAPPAPLLTSSAKTNNPTTERLPQTVDLTPPNTAQLTEASNLTAPSSPSFSQLSSSASILLELSETDQKNKEKELKQKKQTILDKIKKAKTKQQDLKTYTEKTTEKITWYQNLLRKEKKVTDAQEELRKIKESNSQAKRELEIKLQELESAKEAYEKSSDLRPTS